MAMMALPTTLEVASINPTCDSCRWFYGRHDMTIRGREAILGDCRIDSPAVGKDKWPHVWGHDFCGRHAEVMKIMEPQFPKGE